MPTLKEVQGRIAGIRNTQKITKAMKIVAATKLKKYERLRGNAVVFSSAVEAFLHTVVQFSYHPRHPLIGEPQGGSVGGILIIGSDRGLCGAFNSNLFRKAADFIKETHCQSVKVVTVGKRTHTFFKKQPVEILLADDDIEKKSLHEVARSLSDKLVAWYLDGTVHKWCVISNRFTSRSTFDFSHDTILPVMISKEKRREESLYLFEDNISTVLDDLVPLYLMDTIYRALIESKTAEEMSRMMAMDYASENAEELIADLTLYYNRTRQQVITKEISEIVGGAEALK